MIFKVFQPLDQPNILEPSLKNDIVNLLHSASPIHYSFAIVAACLLVAISILVCICTFLKCPKFIEILLTCVSNQCWLKQRAKNRIAELKLGNMFTGKVPARNTFREYQQGMNNDQDPIEIPLITQPIIQLSQRQRQQISHQRQQILHPQEISPPNNPGYRRDHNGQVITQHKNQQFDHQPNPQTDMHMTRASSAPPSNPPPYTPDVNDNPECWNDVQGCVCASDPRYHRQCMQDMSNVQL